MGVKVLVSQLDNNTWVTYNEWIKCTTGVYSEVQIILQLDTVVMEMNKD